MELIKCKHCGSTNVNLKPSLGLNWFECLQKDCGHLWSQDIKPEKEIGKEKK